MTGEVSVRATALGLWVFASSSCSSHVDVGFTNDSGMSATSDGDISGGADRPFQGVDGDLGPGCFVITSCASGRMSQTIEPKSDRCIEACLQSSPDCDAQGVDLSGDSNNCGSCGHECPSAERCVMKSCTR